MRTIKRTVQSASTLARQERPKKLLNQIRNAIRLKHYAYRTEETYVQWIRR
ncbi:hypothetical protein JOY44_25285 (plasmid) [Phormidium sp. CLA17]|uniref:phage integrase N-terminal SAM-like domain-containing protein n=1 Tax=Leptolyngbya sp. Cla-17 TaxID=2803751 RepID=UPI001932ED67|nr:phage integrase N-terminal SAM-like domain-containing protein [Leptolyngbya sp. Cla-17]MBM0744841.1 hypothetical protein [Leptolyngbya sp. Cla-17]